MRYAAVVLTALALAGCGIELLAGTAIQGKLAAEQASTLKGTLDHVKDTTSGWGVDQAVDAYRAEKGSYPPSLEALVPEYMPSVPKNVDGTPVTYDPNTGVVGGVVSPAPAPAARPEPAGDSQADQQTMETIRRAINRYGEATRYFPPTLETLVPYYLAKVPKTSTGQDFLYNPQNGALTIPPAPTGRPQPRPRTAQPRAGGSGAGPMGEMMTGIAIQGELNSMSNAGSSAAGTRARGGARNMGQQQTQRQNQVMNDLGL